MPYTRQRITTNGTRVTEYTRIPADKGTLTAVSASSLTAISLPIHTYALLTLEISQATNPLVLAVLASGYVGYDNAIGWTGRLTLEPDMEIVMTTVSDETTDLDLAVVTEQP